MKKKKNTKTFEHYNIETCGLSGKPINMDKDKWTAVIEYSGNKETSISFYKSELLEELIKNNGKALSKQMLKNILQNIKELTSNFSITHQ
ncbi:MAG: hypothetical protein WD449_01400 [Candidatus Babeliales bacterium]